MTPLPSSRKHVALLLGPLILATAGFSQNTPTPGAAASSPAAVDTSPAARLREYEATYQAGLRKIQTPLLNDYVLKLQQLLATATASEQTAITTEIERVKRILASGAVIDLRSASQPQAASPTPTPPPGGPPSNGNGKGPFPGTRPLLGAVLILKPDTAKGPAVLGSALSIGKAQWTLEHLDAGHYDVSVVISIPAFTGKASVVASLDGDVARADLSETKASSSPDQFRLLRLGKMKFDEDVKDKDLTLTLESTDLSGVQVRQVIISRPRALGK